MSDVHENDKIDIDLKIREAEAYRSQELFSESLGIYEDILSVFPEIDPETKKNITEKIGLLQESIRRLEKEDPSFSEQDISYLKKTWDSDENVHATLTSALSLKELGLYKEAVEEFTNLFDHDYPVKEIIAYLAECLFAIYPPSRVIDQIEKIFKEKNLSDPEKADIHLNLGIEMEKQRQPDLALEIYEAVKNINPNYEGLQDRI
ncbi:MAG: hypothetical protein OEM61_14390, partial [Desulfobacteraceae bacterium]|nr:hypothetical protein [Desulfobacteraceae bacterium]